MKHTLYLNTVYISMLLWILSACTKDNLSSLYPNTENSGNITPPTVVLPPSGKNLIFDDAMLARFVSDYNDGGAGHQFITNNITNPANLALAVTPAPVEYLNNNDGSENHAAEVDAEAARVHVLSLQWLLEKNTESNDADLYLQKAKSFLLAWAATNRATDFMPGEVAYLPFIYAYSIINGELTTEERTTIETWLKDRYHTKYKPFTPRANNWETCRLNLIFDIAYATQDQEMLDFAKQSYGTLLNRNIMADGASEDLLGRDAFAYHAYNLYFYAKIFRSVTVMEGTETGDTFKAQRNTNGGDVKSMVMRMKPYMDDPANNVHLEFVNTEYAPDKQRSDYNKPFNPGSVMYVMNQLVFSYPNEVLSTIRLYQSGVTPFNRDLSFYLFTLNLPRPL